jgi:tRNA nucleotidyltransferase (CCA-adding enzyme)
MNIPSDVRVVLATLEAAGFEAFLVGGCVRDMLLGAAPKDYDLCTNAKPEQMLKVFGDFSVYETGLKHGTLTVRSGGTFVEVTTYRIDGDYSDNRRPDNVVFVGELREDLARRDFTMNAMACDKSGGIMDFFSGRADIENRVIACVGDAEMHFDEDSLRILRGLRFAAVLGFDIENNTVAAMRKKKYLLGNISAERIREEITKLLCGDFAGNVLRKYADILLEVLPELSPMRGFKQNNPYHDFDVWEHTTRVVAAAAPVAYLRLSGLLHDSGKPHCYTEKNGCGHFYGHPKISAEIAEGILSRLKFDTKTKEKILLLIAWHDMQMIPESASIKRILNKIGEENLRDLLLLIRADTAGHSKMCIAERLEGIDRFEGELEEILSTKPCFTLKQLAVNGYDLIVAGYEDGKEIGEALNSLLDAVIDGKCVNDKSELLRYLAESRE